MKLLHVSQDIYPLGEFKTHASRMIRKLRRSRGAIVITQNGKPAAVVITPEEFDRLRDRDLFVDSVHRGLADSAAGRVIDDAEMGRLLAERFGAPEKR